jgi:Domain of Unknown Function (DUF1080)
MKRFNLFAFLLFSSLSSFSQLVPQRGDGDPALTEVWSPEPRVITPGKTSADAPSDAIVLFNRKDLSMWEDKSNGIPKWKVDGGIFTVDSGSGQIKTRRNFGDCQLHIEWRTPSVVKGDGQGRGNSGIFLMGRYELQVLDSYKNRTYSNGQAGAIYKQLIPLANASRPPGEWQTYDVIFTAPRFNADSTVKSPARITVIHNGVLVQNNATLAGGTQYRGIASYQMHGDKEPLVLQDHGNPVSFRNIWIREL